MGCTNEWKTHFSCLPLCQNLYLLLLVNITMKNKPRYTANRCNRDLGEDMENKVFARKADAIRWAKACNYGHVRRLSDARESVFEKSDFAIRGGI